MNRINGDELTVEESALDSFKKSEVPGGICRISANDGVSELQ
jgi:hypothetical protein